MKLFHWKSGAVDLFIVAHSEESARQKLTEHCQSAMAQNPTRLAGIIDDLNLAPYFVAAVGYPVVIGF